MAKKTKRLKKKPARKASSRASARSSKKSAGRSKRSTAAARKRTFSASTRAKKAATATKTKKAAPKPAVKNMATTNESAETEISVKKAAPKKALAKKQVPPRVAAARAPLAYGSSVIRIKTNAKIKRTGRGKSANSVNHRAKAGPAPAATSQDPIQFSEETRRLPKTDLSAKELREFKALLLAKRTELCGDVERLTAEAFHQVDEGGNERSAMPIHMADLGSDNWEQDFTLGLIDTERSVVAEIDQALRRIEDKTYGICLATHNKIGLARLRAKPWAKYCIEYARAREEGRAY